MAQGEWERGFAEVAATLDRVVAARGEGGAAVCVYHHGRKVVDAWTGAKDADGTPWAEDTLAMSFSTTKGVTSTLLHRCVERGLVDYDDEVAKHWPEVANHGKEHITVRQVLCHEAGLYDVTAVASDARDLLDWEHMVGGLATMTPAFEPGTANAYHAVTFGWLVGEIIQRVTGSSFREFLATELAEPLGLDGCFIGTPTAEFHRVARMIRPAKNDLARDPAELVRVAKDLGFEIHPEIIARALPPFAIELPAEESLKVPIPAGNGTFTARSLARVYALLAAGGTLDGVKLLAPQTIARATEVQNLRADLVLGFPMAWRLGYHGVVTSAGILDQGFGHNGLGGSGAFADPEHELAVAFTLNALSSLIAGDTRFTDVAGAAVTAAVEAS